MAETHAPMEMESDYATEFRVNQRVISLGEIAVYPAECQPLVFRRTAKLIRKADPEAYHLSLIQRGEGHVTLGKETRTHRAYDLHTSDTSRVWEIQTGREPLRFIGVEIPKALLPLPAREADRVTGGRLSAREGTGALLAQFLTRMVADSRSYRPAEAPRLRTVLADLVAAVFAGSLDAERSLPYETHRRTLALSIRTFIRENADDSRLDVPSIAAAHHISVSYLHRLFQQEGDGTTVGRALLRQRLEHARRDLLDPLLRDMPVHVIAARRGFSHAAAFSRAFRDAYAMTPTAYRRTTPTTGGGV
ncbi:AraC family transcriptional regulator [Streptomyces sp. TX20-6-3]|uniref:helix-turn-helix transcriptional regulator n=1 Tax=Streptomyces sp. TX20-6-3 TaxID=3028705 RepID=UPI0029A3FFEF|nr:AraC family transcriptional regulator [Streptomyces sp. TX20-6-3]MDX2563308.1 AraC family transcriptional regulator [Streptomyces sp. TX20-6-3]